jgi:hypothetical protein
VYGKIHVYGQVSSEEVTKLAQLLQLFASAKHLQLKSARFGSDIDKDVPMNFNSLP